MPRAVIVMSAGLAEALVQAFNRFTETRVVWWRGARSVRSLPHPQTRRMARQTIPTKHSVTSIAPKKVL